jgi:DNA repair exonuclease SbcCD ATPase subunit
VLYNHETELKNIDGKYNGIKANDINQIKKELLAKCTEIVAGLLERVAELEEQVKQSSEQEEKIIELTQQLNVVTEERENLRNGTTRPTPDRDTSEELQELQEKIQLLVTQLRQAKDLFLEAQVLPTACDPLRKAQNQASDFGRRLSIAEQKIARGAVERKQGQENKGVPDALQEGDQGSEGKPCRNTEEARQCQRRNRVRERINLVAGRTGYRCPRRRRTIASRGCRVTTDRLHLCHS